MLTNQGAINFNTYSVEELDSAFLFLLLKFPVLMNLASECGRSGEDNESGNC